MSDFLLHFELTHSRTSLLRTSKGQSLVSLEPSEFSITERCFPYYRRVCEEMFGCMIKPTMFGYGVKRSFSLFSCFKRPHARNNTKKAHTNIFIVVVYLLRLQFFLIQVLVYSHTCQANLLQTKMVNVALLAFNIFTFGRFVVLFL